MNNKNNAPLLWFTELNLKDVPLVGGKGASLGEMTQAGMPIPEGFVVSTTAFTKWLDQLDTKHEIRARISSLAHDDLANIAAETMAIRELMINTPISLELNEALTEAYIKMGDGTPVAVRSSATSEDSEEASFAGLQDTYLWVEGLPALLEKVRACWASLYSPESVSYRRRLNLPEDQLAMAVVVQSMVNSRCSGVMFTRSPTSGDRSVITIEGSYGLGSAIVSGEVTPDRYALNKVTFEFKSRQVAEKSVEHVPGQGGVIELVVNGPRNKEACMSDEEILSLARLGKQVEKHYGSPQDIEWAIDQDGNLRLLQSRPETVWASKEQAPIATEAVSAFDHIYALMGGKQS
jgi:pyruvate,water dikinase